MDSALSQGTRSFGTIADRFNSRLGRSFVRYLELRLQLFGLESRETGFICSFFLCCW